MSFVTSRGLLHSCDSYQRRISSSNPSIHEDILKDISDTSTVYVCTTAIPAFVNNYLPRLKNYITLVTGDADQSVLTTNVHCATILASPFIKRWFAQNCVSSHPKLIHMPIGLAYHTVADRATEWGPRQSEAEQELDIVNLRSKMKPFYERIPRCYSTFHLILDRGDRREAYSSVPKELVYYEPYIVHRINSFLTQTQYAFVLSPAGGGPDCHRTWEALVMGCIPIVKSSGLDPVFEGLPVLIVKAWSDITQELLDTTILLFRDRTFSYEKLTLDYWRRLFKSTAAAEIDPEPNIPCIDLDSFEGTGSGQEFNHKDSHDQVTPQIILTSEAITLQSFSDTESCDALMCISGGIFGAGPKAETNLNLVVGHDQVTPQIILTPEAITLQSFSDTESCDALMCISGASSGLVQRQRLT